MYKIETHLHTMYSSRCGKLDAATIVSGYIDAGYSGLIVTDHFNRVTFDVKNIDIFSNVDKAACFLEGYYKIKEEGEKQGLIIYKGAEFRFDESENDYLVYGFQDQLLSDPNSIFELGLKGFYQRCKDDNMLIIQAHPFRRGCQPANPRYLDGVEVQNMHPTHESHNELAWEFAHSNRALVRLSGSDCHRADDIGRGGICVEALPNSETELVSILKQRKYSLIG
jgi:hypothetical protein